MHKCWSLCEYIGVTEQYYFNTFGAVYLRYFRQQPAHLALFFNVTFSLAKSFNLLMFILKFFLIKCLNHQDTNRIVLNVLCDCVTIRPSGRNRWRFRYVENTLKARYRNMK